MLRVEQNKDELISREKGIMDRRAHISPLFDDPPHLTLKRIFVRKKVLSIPNHCRWNSNCVWTACT